MKITSTILCLMLLAAGAATPAGAAERTYTELPADRSFKPRMALDAAENCLLYRHNPDDSVLGYNSGYVTGERTVVYFDPAVCDTLPYPFEVQNFWFTLLDPPSFMDPRAYEWPLEIDVIIYDVRASGDSCEGPGTELRRVSVVCDSATYAYPEVAAVTFDPPVCLERPFFIGIEYTDTSSAPFPSVLYDTDSSPDLCHAFMFCCDSIWAGWYAYWIDPPGFPFYWVEGESRSLSCCDDADGDQICARYDNCPATANADQADADGDGVGDACDNCPEDANPGQEDTDGDTFADACDNCPSVSNAGQVDTDGDGIGDACDACPDDPSNDIDGDGICGNVDNCPNHANPGQEDADSDGVGDACETLDDCLGIRGNADGYINDVINISDLTFIVDYLFKGGPPPPVMEEADVDGSGDVNIADVTYLVNYLFKGGPDPQPCP